MLVCDRGGSGVLCGLPGVTSTPTMALTCFSTFCEAGALGIFLNAELHGTLKEYQDSCHRCDVLNPHPSSLSANTAIKATRTVLLS
jgi:hypothetical protein